MGEGPLTRRLARLPRRFVRPGLARDRRDTRCRTPGKPLVREEFRRRAERPPPGTEDDYTTRCGECEVEFTAFGRRRRSDPKRCTRSVAKPTAMPLVKAARSPSGASSVS